MYDIKTEDNLLSRRYQPVATNGRNGAKSHKALVEATQVAQDAIAATLAQPEEPAVSPEMLVPRLGERLVKKGLLTESELKRALEEQAALAQEGERIRLGQLLIQMGFISREQLDRTVTQQVLGLQRALERSNQELERRVQERTAQLENALIRLSELSQLKANFIANLSHELRTPLYGLTGYLELLAAEALGPLNGAQAQAVVSLERSGQRLNRLVEDLLQFSEASTGEIQLQMTPFSIEKPIRTAVERFMENARSREVKLDTRLPEQSPRVTADKKKITWVISHFLDNAIKFTPPGGRVKIETFPRQEKVTVSVSDTGIGIPQERIAEAFLPFHQLDGSSTRQYGGTGLGLALARSIVEAHGSTIKVDSQVGQGSRFAFSLPLA